MAALQAEKKSHKQTGWMLGIVTALIVHLVKSSTRPVVNATTAGVGAPVVSTVEDAGSLSLSLVAVFLPVLVLVFLAGMIAVGSLIGGFIGAGVGRKLPAPVLRGAIVLLGVYAIWRIVSLE